MSIGWAINNVYFKGIYKGSSILIVGKRKKERMNK